MHVSLYVMLTTHSCKHLSQGFDSTTHCDIVVVVVVIHTCQQVMYDHKMHPMTMNCNWGNQIWLKQSWYLHSVASGRQRVELRWLINNSFFVSNHLHHPKKLVILLWMLLPPSLWWIIQRRTEILCQAKHPVHLTSVYLMSHAWQVLDLLQAFPLCIWTL